MHNASFGLAFHDKACGFSDQEVADLRYLARMLACRHINRDCEGMVSGLLTSCLLAGEVPEWAGGEIRYWVSNFRLWGAPEDAMPPIRPVRAVANPTEEG